MKYFDSKHWLLLFRSDSECEFSCHLLAIQATFLCFVIIKIINCHGNRHVKVFRRNNGITSNILRGDFEYKSDWVRTWELYATHNALRFLELTYHLQGHAVVHFSSPTQPTPGSFQHYNLSFESRLVFARALLSHRPSRGSYRLCRWCSENVCNRGGLQRRE
jgi:hypothetical protein